MIPGLAGDDLALKGGQHLLRLGQAQAQIGDVAQVSRLRDLHHVHTPTIAISAGFHQPQDLGHSRHSHREKSAIVYRLFVPPPKHEAVPLTTPYFTGSSLAAAFGSPTLSATGCYPTSP
jgi:hypothetical protein